MENLQTDATCEDSKYGYIYIIVNSINGKIYIGQHKGSCLDEKYWGSGKLLGKAIEKYGLQNFSRDVLEWCSSREALNQQEIYWIKKFNATDSVIGYNLSRGGNCPNIEHLSLEHREKIRQSNIGKHNCSELTRKKISDSNKGKHSSISEETRQKISQANKGKHLSLETKQKLSDIKTGKKLNLTDEQRQRIVDRLTGVNNPNYGKPRSDEVRKKISEANKGKPGSRRGMHNSAEHNRRIVEANTGRECSKETRDKMRKSAHERVCTLICQCCGGTFNARGPRTKFCDLCRGD